MKLVALLLLLLPLSLAVGQMNDNIDPQTGLIMSPGWLHVRANCGGCHSHAMVTGQRAERERWLEMIRWMQETQNLWQFAPDVENAILDYLADNYGPEAARRRAPIPPSLMPGGDGQGQ